MTKEEQAQELLKKYIDKKASPAEIAQVERWYASSGIEIPPIEKERKEEIRAVVLQKLRQKMESEPEVKRFRLPGFYQLGKVAAVLLLVSGAGIAGWWLNNRPVDQEKLLSLTTSSREKKKIVFADGSVVVLGPSARLLYPEKFKSRDRTISLTEGEAFFEISPDVNRPFMVKTSHDLYTKVLGTSFRIKAYGKSRLISVAVSTGKVAVGNAHQVFGTLGKGQQIAYDKIDERAEISYTPVKTFVNLRFENTSLQEVARQLEQAYGIRISINNPTLKTLKCSATFNTKQNPEEVLDIICSLHHLRFRISDDHKTFNVYRR
ncbi:FecR family protein [Pedobacter caeni]|uniref:FecR family protein n=1 Tax=Pedobacter caeni TaxID=288992 RepID=A0A1M5JI15_9SPHI|nr:FecR domain-containing protein [Pedobacter caeni]SHG40234.1 FecR family protein [Pedobacter caeni]